MTVHFFFPNDRITLNNRQGLKHFLKNLFIRKRVRISSLTYVFCADDYLLQINKVYLNHDYYTDIISFDLAEPGSPVEGEIYISIDRIRENALQLGVSIKEELHRVIFHGALHLCGYSDKTKADKAKMTQEENRELCLYFDNVPRGTK